jgi:protocatechuate 3,4-dioxygenase beta subunit
VISGIVYGPDCQTPLAGAIVDVWQANEKGSYDNDGNNDPPNGEYKLRGRMKTNDKGEYEYTTIVPGRYLNGATYRPAHIHYKVSEPNHQELTTQLYFKGDPYIAKDPFVHASLVINLTAHNKGKKGQFDIVLKKKS